MGTFKKSISPDTFLAFWHFVNRNAVRILGTLWPKGIEVYKILVYNNVLNDAVQMSLHFVFHIFFFSLEIPVEEQRNITVTYLKLK